MTHSHRVYVPLSGTIDGVNTDFELPEDPIPGSVRVFVNGLEQLVDLDFTVSGRKITFASPPEPGDEIFAHYLVEEQ